MEPPETQLSPDQIHAERPHATRSSSQLGTLAVCEGFKPLNTKKVHWVTAQGNRGHAALDGGDDELLDTDFEQRMKDCCEKYSNSLPPAEQIFEEIKLNTIEGRWGYTDRLRLRENPVPGHGMMYAPDTADLLDWKFVRVKEVTDAEINLQGKDYVVGIFEDPRFPDINTIHVHFVMPRFESVSTATFTRDDIPRLKLEIFAVLRRARRSDSKSYRGHTLVPNYESCRYCGAAGNCVALRKVADTLGRAYDPANYGIHPPIPTETHASLVKDATSRAQLQKLAGLMEQWAKSVRHHNLTASLEDDKNLPEGYAIEWAKGKRFITSVDGLFLAAKEFNLTTADLVEAATISWTKIEDKLRERAARGTKQSVVTDFNQRLLELAAVDRPEPSPKLGKS